MMLAQKTDLQQIAEKTLKRVAGLEMDVAIIKSNCATKQDIAAVETQIARVETRIAKMESSLIKWTIGVSVALVTLAFAAGRFVH